MTAGFDPIYDPTYGELMSVIRRVRLRWRLKVALRGLVLLIAAGFAAFAVSVWGMDYFLYSEGAVTVFRWLAWLTLAALAVRLLAVPLAQRVSRRQVALYVEEHEPALRSSVLSAVELGPVRQGTAGTDERVSPELQRQVLEDAIEQCQQSGFATRIERGALRRFSAALAGVASAGMVAVLLSPAFLQHGAMLLFTPWRAAAADNPYRLVLAPGNTTVARGSDQLIGAAVLGFDPDRVEVGLRPLDDDGNPDGEWRHWPMNRVADGFEVDDERMIGDTPATHDFIALNLRSDTDYYVDASGIRSPIYRIRVRDLPYVDRIDLRYRFPDYSGLSDRTVEDGGDIAVLRGTEVQFSILPIFQVEAGRLLVEGDEPRDLAVQGDRLTAAWTVDRSTYYRIELMDDEGRWHRASAEYMVTGLEDQPTIVRFTAPGRDVKVSMIDEVFAQVEAEDDYGVRRLAVRYAVNGGEEASVRLFDSASSSMKKVSAGHTFFLEEMDLQVGDSISYYAEAWDRSHAQPAISDIYFLEIRPFDRNYRQAEQGGGAGGGAGGLDQTLSVQQKMIISATFRLVRDREEYTAEELSRNLTTVALMQGRLREQVASLVMRMGNRGQQLLEDDDFSKIIGFLEQAGAEMAAARQELEAERPEAAMVEEKKALASVQRAESVFREMRVSFEQGGGGGSGNQQLSEDLADLFELELDKLRNQYETVQRGAAEQAQAEVDELMQKLRELARRQQRENERQNRLRSRSQQGGGGGGRQQELIEETEELARRLERLAREQQRPEFQETTQALRQAVEQMKRSRAGASGSQQGVGGEGTAALDRLREARRLLDRNRRQQLGRDMEELQERAARVSRMQSRIEQQVGELAAGQEDEGGQEPGSLSEQERADLVQRIMERKDSLTDEVAGLEAQLNRMSQGARNDQPETARKLRESATVIRDEQLKEKIRYSKGVLAGRDAEFARLFENQIRQDIDEVAERIADARASVGEGGGARHDRMLEQTRDLVENLASMDARLRDRVEAGGGRLGRRPGQENEQDGSQQDGSQQDGEQQSGRQQAGGPQGSQPGAPSSEAGGGDAPSLEGGRNRGRLSPYGSSSGGYFQPGIFPAEDLRQLDRELDQRRADLENLRNDLRRERMDTADLDQLLRQMGDLSLLGLDRDPLALERLRNEIVEGLRQFEYRLWRELRGGDTERVYLGNSDQVPPGYRDLVDEYFRKLASES